MRGSIVHAALLLSTFALATRVAAAESIGIVAVAEPPGPSAELAELTLQLRMVASEQSAGVVNTNEVRERMTGQTSSATFAELQRAYAGALATYQNGDFEGALGTLRAVVQDLERLPPSAEAFNQWTRAMLRLARTEQTLGHGGEARELLERLVRANPKVTVDQNQYPPSFVRQVAETSAEMKMLVKRKLAVAATAKGAKVFVEGREVGIAPITLDLPSGRYRISGSHGGVHVPAVVVDLAEGGQSVTLNFALAQALRPSLGPGLALPEKDRASDLVSAGNWLRVDKLLAARLTTDSGVEYLAGTFFDVRRGMLLREARVRLANRMAPAGALSALASFLMTGQPSKLIAQVQLAPPPDTEAAEPEAIPAASASAKPLAESTAPSPSTKPGALRPSEKIAPEGGEETAPARRKGLAAYVTMGSGGALLVSGALVGLVARSRYNALRDEKGTSGYYEDYISRKGRIRTLAVTADVLMVTGLAAGGVGGWLYWRGRRAPDPRFAIFAAPSGDGAALVAAGRF